MISGCFASRNRDLEAEFSDINEEQMKAAREPRNRYQKLRLTRFYLTDFSDFFSPDAQRTVLSNDTLKSPENSS